MFKLFKIKTTEYPIFLLWLLIASLYVRPYNSIMQPFYEYGNYSVFLYSSYMVVDKWKSSSKFLKAVYMLLIVSVLFLIASRLLNGYGYDNKFSSVYLYNIALINLFTYGIIDKTWVKLKAFSFLLLIYIVINFITIINYPEGLYATDIYTSNWFLGFKNVMIRLILPGVALNILCSIYDFGKPNIKDYLLMFVALYSVYLVDSSTSILMMCIFIVGVLYWLFKKGNAQLSLFKCFWITTCISIAFTMFSFQSYFSSLIETLFEKDATFTGRTYVWAFTLMRLLDSPIIGFGWHSADEWREVLGFYGQGFDMGFSHPHNFILYLLLQGGVVYLSLFFILCFYISKKDINFNAWNYILTLLFLTFFIEGITESLTGAIFFMPFFGLYPSFVGMGICNNKSNYEKNSYNNICINK